MKNNKHIFVASSAILNFNSIFVEVYLLERLNQSISFFLGKQTTL